VGLKILHVFGYPLRTGGHVKSGLTMLTHLSAAGHRGVIASPPGGAKDVVREFRKTGAELHELSELSNPRRHPIARGARRIARLARELSVEVIHGQDFFATGRAYLASALSGRPLVHTVAGGAISHLPLPRECQSVLFSQELMDGFLSRFNPNRSDLHVIRARIDRRVHRPVEVDPSFIRQHGLPEEGRKLTMAMNLNAGKSAWIRTILELAGELGRQDGDSRIVVAGEGVLLSSLRERAARINAGAGNRAVLHFVGPIFGAEDLNRFHNYGDLVVGHGRGVLEAMACGKPALVLGENGDGELITPQNVENVAHFNFSGRHLRQRSAPVDPLAVTVTRVLDDGEALARLGTFSFEYVKTQMDARLGAAQLAAVYQRALGRRCSLSAYARWYLASFIARTREGVRLRLGQRRSGQPRSG
jgi:glycosyltransferase involved in cell wall biosynthesis